MDQERGPEQQTRIKQADSGGASERAGSRVCQTGRNQQKPECCLFCVRFTEQVSEGGFGSEIDR